MQLALVNTKILTTPAKVVALPLSATHQELIKSMLENINSISPELDGFPVGLAAPQVGYGLKIFIYQVPKALASKHGIEPVPPTAVINPDYIPASDHQEFMWEGCLSIPKKAAEILRYTQIICNSYDQHGQPQRQELSGILAHIFQHEIDHTNGILFTDRLSPTKQLHDL